MTDKQDFFMAHMPDSRQADLCLGWREGSIFLDFNIANDSEVSLIRISFDNYGSCDISNPVPLSSSESLLFLGTITNDLFDQETLTRLVRIAISANKDFIWTDALEAYSLL